MPRKPWKWTSSSFREYDNAAMKPRISPIEVKSTKRYGVSSLDKFRKRYAQRLGKEYVLHPRQLRKWMETHQIPLYGPLSVICAD